MADRRGVRVVFAIAVLVLAALGIWSATGGSPTWHGGLPGAPLSTGTPADPVISPTASLDVAPALGVNVDLRPLNSVARRDTLARLAQAGIRQVRQPVSWADMEPRSGVYDTAFLDGLVADAEILGLRVLLAIGESPAWARGGDPVVPPHLWICDDPLVTGPHLDHHRPPTDPADLAAFAAYLAGRYRADLWAMEIWTEPNLLPNWRATGPDPEGYARLLVPVAAAVKDAAPEVLVVSGALAPTTDLGVCYMSDVAFLDRLARSGALADVDAVAIEPFGLRDPPAAGPVDREALNFRRAEVLRAVLVRHGLDRPLWAAAWGWHVSGDQGEPDAQGGTEGPWGSHSVEEVAAWTGQAYALARSEWPWLTEMFLWHLAPAAPPDDPQWGFALLNLEGQPTVLWSTAVELANGRLPPAPRTAGPPAWPLWGLALAASTCLGAILAGSRRRLAPRLRVLMQPLRRLSTPQLAALCGAALLANALLPWPASLISIPVLGLVATVSSAVAIVAVTAVAPLYYALHLWLGPRAFEAVELVILIALAGRLAAWYLAPAQSWPRLQIRDWRSSISRLHVADWLVVALVLWATASLAWSEFLEPALRQWRTVVLEPALFYGLLRVHGQRRVIARLALDGLALGAVVAALWALIGLGLWQLDWGGAAVRAEGVLRATGPYASPNNLALLLGRVLPIVAVYALWAAGRRRLVYRLSAPIVLVALAATFSRGALLVGLPLIVLYLGAVAWRWKQRRAVVTVVMALLVMALALLPFAATDRIRGVTQLAPGSTGHIRLRLWQSALSMVGDHPWGGVGLDNFLYLYRDRYVQRDAVQERFLNHPHNWLLDWWTRLGILGLGLFLGLVAANLAAARRAWSRRGATRLLGVAALGMQLYALGHGLVDHSFFLVDLAVAWWAAQAALLAAADPAPRALKGRENQSVVGPPGFEPGTNRL